MKRYFFILLIPVAISHSAFAATEKTNTQAPQVTPVQQDDFNKDCGGIPNGGTITGYQTATAPCIPATVTCFNGVLNGPPPIMSCIDNPFSNEF